MARRTVSIAEAERLTGLSKKALRGRVDRGTLPATVEDGARRIAVADLVRAGLLTEENIPPPDAGDVDGALDRLERHADELRALVADVRAELAIERKSRG